MHKIYFYPVGNGDCSQIVLENGKRILMDYRHEAFYENEDTPQINLKKHLKDELKKANKNYFDIVAFTHGDADHIEGSTEFFYLEHAKCYQSDERIKIKELWVPAAMILEEGTNDNQSKEVIILRQEARHRLIEGKGIKVFSRPDKLKSFLEKKHIDPDSRKHLIVDAGQVVNTFNLGRDGVEFFCHSPFIKHCDDGDIERNTAALIFQIRFKCYQQVINYLAIGDSTAEVLEDIVDITKYHGREDRLDWNLYNIPHHCSYLALNIDGNKGDKKTEPLPNVKTLLEHAQKNAIIVISSKPIRNDQEAYDAIQPPHIQAKNTYDEYLNKANGRKIYVTMEYPNEKNPKPLEFEISSQGIRLVPIAVGGAALASQNIGRAG